MRSNRLWIPCVLFLAAAAHGQGTDLARGGIASQSSTDFSGVAARGIDGVTDPTWGAGSITHTADLSNSWWEVDLLSTYTLGRIVLYNRKDCCHTRLSNFRVSVFDGATEVWGADYYVGSGSVGAGSAHVVDLPGVPGDRVRVGFLGLNNDGNGFLSLAEVLVYEWIELQRNVAPFGVATQSATAWGGAPERAIDGDINGNYSDGSVSHTTDAPGSWWELDLGGPHELDHVRLWNRADCCPGRLANFRVSVHDSLGEVWGQDFATTGGSVDWGGLLHVDLPAGTLGERVRVELLGPGPTGEQILALAEVEVLGTLGTPHCTSLPNSTGAPTVLSVIGSASVSTNELRLLAVPTPPGENGIFFYGPNRALAPLGNGFRCVGGGLVRLGVTAEDGGMLTQAVDLANPPMPRGLILPGSTWSFQCFYWDAAAPGAGYNLSDAVEVVFAP